MFELSQPIFAKNLKLPFHVDWIQERRLCIEFLAQCNATKAKESNPACQVQVEGLTDDEPPQITVTFVNRVEEKFDATSTPAQTNCTMILEECQSCETEKIFREAGEKWPVIIPEEEHNQPFHGSKSFCGNAYGISRIRGWFVADSNSATISTSFVSWFCNQWWNNKIDL